VIASSVPGGVLQVFADELEVPMAYVISAMTQPLGGFGGRQFKAGHEPRFISHRSWSVLKSVKQKFESKDTLTI
jgi:hypothetical protein